MGFWDVEDRTSKDYEGAYSTSKKIKSTVKAVYEDVLELRKWLFKYVINGLGTVQKSLIDSVLNATGKEGWYLRIRNDNVVDLVDPSTLENQTIYRGTIVGRDEMTTEMEGYFNYTPVSLVGFSRIGVGIELADKWGKKSFKIEDIGGDLNNFDQSTYDAWETFYNAPNYATCVPSYLFWDSEPTSHNNDLTRMKQDLSYDIFFKVTNDLAMQSLSSAMYTFSDTMLNYKATHDSATMKWGTVESELPVRHPLAEVYDTAVEFEFTDKIGFLFSIQGLEANAVTYLIANGYENRFAFQYILDFGTPSEQRFTREITGYNAFQSLVYETVEASGTHRVIVKYMGGQNLNSYRCNILLNGIFTDYDGIKFQVERT